MSHRSFFSPFMCVLHSSFCRETLRFISNSIETSEFQSLQFFTAKIEVNQPTNEAFEVTIMFVHKASFTAKTFWFSFWNGLIIQTTNISVFDP